MINCRSCRRCNDSIFIYFRGRNGDVRGEEQQTANKKMTTTATINDDDDDDEEGDEQQTRRSMDYLK